MAKARSRPAQRRERAPDGKRAGDDTASAGLVGKKGERNAERRIEHCEGEAADCSELRVGKVQVGLDRLGEDPEDLPVQEVENVGDEQERKHQ